MIVNMSALTFVMNMPKTTNRQFSKLDERTRKKKKLEEEETTKTNDKCNFVPLYPIYV
jgi:hypothetical protein